jgi:hypothetical protein
LDKTSEKGGSLFIITYERTKAFSILIFNKWSLAMVALVFLAFGNLFGNVRKEIYPPREKKGSARTKKKRRTLPSAACPKEAMFYKERSRQDMPFLVFEKQRRKSCWKSKT